jgi:hypothetical protein
MAGIDAVGHIRTAEHLLERADHLTYGDGSGTTLGVLQGIGAAVQAVAEATIALAKGTDLQPIAGVLDTTYPAPSPASVASIVEAAAPAGSWGWGVLQLDPLVEYVDIRRDRDDAEAECARRRQADPVNRSRYVVVELVEPGPDQRG